MHGDLAAILQSLPAPHRRYLIKANAERIVAKPKPRTEDEKLVLLARSLGNDVVSRYRFAYLDRKSRFVSLYQIEQPPRTRHAIHSAGALSDAMREHFPNLTMSQEPELVPGGPPLYNRADSLPDGSFVIDLVSTAEEERLIRVGYGYERRRLIDHHFITVMNKTPPLLEVPSRGDVERAAYLKCICGLTGIAEAHVKPVSFSRPGHWHELQRHLNATIGGHAGNGRRGQPEAYSMHVKAGESLDTYAMWTSLGVPHDRARELRFTCSIVQPIDNYPEMVTFYLNLISWQIKFKPHTSEHALATVTDAYIDIAKRP